MELARKLVTNGPEEAQKHGWSRTYVWDLESHYNPLEEEIGEKYLRAVSER